MADQMRVWNYPIWYAMMRRCYNKDDKGHSNYGGRGITVCERWHDFRNFCEDMGLRSINMTLERKDNEQGYSKANCCWLTKAEQNGNRRPRMVRNASTGEAYRPA